MSGSGANLLEEDRFLRETAGVIDQPPRGFLRVSGRTVTDLLQRLVTSDVRALSVGQFQSSCLLTGKGKLLAAFHLHRESEEAYVLHFAEPPREEVSRVLEKYSSLEDVEVKARGNSESLWLRGPLAEALLRGWIEQGTLPVDPFQEEIVFMEGLRLFILRRPEALEGGWEVRNVNAAREPLIRKAREMGGGPVGPIVAEAHRIEAGIPRWGVDFDGQNFPNEAGWESALSYTKGCYIGQEVIARMRTYGHLNRKLMALAFPDAREAPAGTRLYREGKEAGSITSSAVSLKTKRTLALGYLRSSAWEPGTRLASGSPEGAPDVEVADRPAGGPPARETKDNQAS